MKNWALARPDSSAILNVAQYYSCFTLLCPVYTPKLHNFTQKKAAK